MTSKYPLLQIDAREGECPDLMNAIRSKLIRLKPKQKAHVITVAQSTLKSIAHFCDVLEFDLIVAENENGEHHFLITNNK